MRLSLIWAANPCLFGMLASLVVFGDREAGNPAAVLLDIKIPRTDAIEVLRKIPVDGHLRRIPVVTLSSSCEKRDPAAAWDPGVNAHVVKLVDADQCSTRSGLSVGSGRS